MTEFNDIFIFWLVVGLRFFVPLLIPRYPLPAIIASLTIDAVDQTVFQKFTNLNLDGYQGYDKALDIYYLTIAYLSVLRNWKNQYAVKVAKFLWYYRLFGIALFELTYSGVGPRWLLFIFPNTFEYFFIFYETIKLRWDTRKLSNKFILLSAAFIWIFIKLPQEYWIHIAQLDVTDFLKEKIFGVPTDAGLTEILNVNYWLIPTVVVLIVGAVVLIKYIKGRLPKPDWTFKYKSDSIDNFRNTKFVDKQNFKSIFSSQLLEKIILITLVLIIFVQMLELDIKSVSVLIGVLVVLVTSSFVTILISRYIKISQTISMPVTFIFMLIINFAITIGYGILFNIGNSTNLVTLLFFLSLLTLISVMFDRYSTVYLSRK